MGSLFRNPTGLSSSYIDENDDVPPRLEKSTGASSNESTFDEENRGKSKNDSCSKKLDRITSTESKEIIRIATLNVGTLSGRIYDLVEVLDRRRINVCCLQETKKVGSGSSRLKNGYKLFYYGEHRTSKGAAIVVDRTYQDRIEGVAFVSDRIVCIKLTLDSRLCVNVLSVYAPCSNGSQRSKQAFWKDLTQLMQCIPLREATYIGGDFNGHVGRKNPLYELQHGGFGIGKLNENGEKLLAFTARFDLEIANTYFPKNDEGLMTFTSGGKSTQIDYILVDGRHFKCLDCVAVAEESLAKQHRLLMAEIVPKMGLVDVKDVNRDRDLKFYKFTELLCNRVTRHLDGYRESGGDELNRMWDDFEGFCMGFPYDERTKRIDEREKVSVSKRHQQLDCEKCPMNIVSTNDLPLFPSTHRSLVPLIEYITKEEVRQAVLELKLEHRANDDFLPRRVWKHLGTGWIEWLTTLFRKILHNKTMPESWLDNCKNVLAHDHNETDHQISGNDSHVQLISQTVKIWEIVLCTRLTKLTNGYVPTNFLSSVDEKSRLEAIQTLRILMEKFRDGKRVLDMIFLNVDKAFECVPKSLVCEALRSHGVQEDYIVVLMSMYSHGESGRNLSLHSHSALNKCLITLLVNHITKYPKNVQSLEKWKIIVCGDEILLINDGIDQLQDVLNDWCSAFGAYGVIFDPDKIKHMSCSFKQDVFQYKDRDIWLKGCKIEKVKRFNFLGSIFTADCDLEFDVIQKVNETYRKFRRTDVMLDMEALEKYQGAVYELELRSKMLYGYECRVRKQECDRLIDDAEVNMLKTLRGEQLKNATRKEVRETFCLPPLDVALDRKCADWYEHISNLPDDHVLKVVLNLLIEPQRSVGRPLKTWRQDYDAYITKHKA